MTKLRVITTFAKVRWFERFTDAGALRRHQDVQLRRHLRFIWKKSSYFQKYSQPQSFEELSSLPIMDKSVMMDHFDDLNTVGIKRDEALALALSSERDRTFTQKAGSVSVGLSSGTSGHRGLFVVSDREREEWAGTVLAHYLPKGRLLGHRIAFFLRADNNLYQTVGSRVISFRYFDIYDDMRQNIEALSAFRPTILVAPPSVLSVIAESVEDSTVSLDVQRLISVAEVLDPHDERRFKAVFKQTVVHQVYQSTEGFLAHTCEEGTIHLNENTVIVERESVGPGRFVPIVTDLKRTSQPIIRYRLNDVLRLSRRPCPCGSALTAISRIEGREGDIFVFKDRGGRNVRVFADMIGRCMIYASGFHEFRVVQTGYGHLDVYLDVVDGRTSQGVTHEISRLADRLGFEPPRISFKAYAPDMTKKRRRVERQFDI